VQNFKSAVQSIKVFYCETCGASCKSVSQLTDGLLYCDTCAHVAIEDSKAQQRADQIRKGWDE
jgi:hypothetical protein